MQYMGSKNRLAKELIPIILSEKREYYVEPFLGGANMMNKVEGVKRIGSDNNPYLIALWKALQSGWKPPKNLTKEEYKEIKDNKDNYSMELVAFVGFLCSFGGKWFGGYSQNKKGDNYAQRGHNVLLKDIEKMKDVEFIHSSYLELDIPDNSIIYCDPPYANTTSYKDKFNHEEFWEWCRNKTKEGHILYVSEYNAPDDFICVFEKEVKTILNKNNQNTIRVEKLFKLRN